MSLQARLIPILQIQGPNAVKTTQFRSLRYVGSALNAMRSFSELEVDELILVDLTNELEKSSKAHWTFLEQLASEAFMPVSYGGGVHSAQQAIRLVRIGFEKVNVGRHAVTQPGLIQDIAHTLGSQAVVAAVDLIEHARGYRVMRGLSRSAVNVNYTARLDQLAQEPIGELLITSVNREGTRQGLDLRILDVALSSMTTPVVLAGGASSLTDCVRAIEHGASGVAAGDLCVCLGNDSATLIHVPWRFRSNQR